MTRFTEVGRGIQNGATMRPLQDNDVFHAIAHPARRAILVELKKANALRASSPHLRDDLRRDSSQHLRVLEEAELVTVRCEGRHALSAATEAARGCRQLGRRVCGRSSVSVSTH